MSWTKRQFVTQAFDALGYASHLYDLDPAQLQSALRQLDAMIATWNGRGIRLGYPLPSSPEKSSLDDTTDVPDAANEAIYANLAVRIAPTVGKQVHPDLRATAGRAYSQLIARFAEPVEVQLPSTMPLGAGGKNYRHNHPFVHRPTEHVKAGSDGPIELD